MDSTLATAKGASLPSANPTIQESIFFSLPTELRIQILDLALDPPEEGVPLGQPGSCPSNDVLSIFLVSKQIYADAVPIYYRNVCIDLNSRSSAEKDARRFLERATIPRQHIRSVTVCLRMVDCSSCQAVSGLGLERFVELRRLTMLIGPDYPYPPYGCAVHPPTRPRHHFKSWLDSGEQVTGPVCLKEKNFQGLLQSLRRPEFGEVSVKVHRFHLEFLCQFHGPDRARECRGEWRGQQDWVPLDCEAMVRALSKAQVDDSVAPERSCVRYRQSDLAVVI
ncbi:hypothetical protein BKA67DRAFT_655975 [Truncatella angustata]|uniref:F-box domain-containing protein n=1 Tax=Truncatella angustata TaxID=152316 RepID=A0A9P8UT57_9PEZI|nr:uncharacterized protein BKA67DRAFT_655975 [Truncatella angustata]KAH6657729.1 hypothetical protein BKA67DRAFT_655975 [Truncatella angustata]